MIKKILFIVTILLLVSCLVKPEEPDVEKDDSTGFTTVTLTWGNFKWKVENDNLEVIMTGNTSGWVSIGFNPSFAMKDANIIIGYVESGIVNIRDDFGISSYTHVDDETISGTNDIIEYSGEEIVNTTTISFSIPLNSGDSRDSVLVSGATVKVIFAIGNSDSFTDTHTNKTSIDITL